MRLCGGFTGGLCGALEHSLARGGTRHIVVNAITDDDQLRVVREDEDGDCYVEEAIRMYEYEKHEDYQSAFDGDSLFLPAWHAMYPGTPLILVLDNCPSHLDNWRDNPPHHAQ